VRILYVVTRADAVGGASVHVRDLAQAMQARGHQVLVLTGGVGPVTRQLEQAGVPFQPLLHLQRSIRPWRDLRSLGEITRSIRAFQPHLASLHTSKAGWLGRAACARLGIPALYTPHGWTFAGRISGPVSPLLLWAERAASRWSSLIICVCEYELRLALRMRIAPRDRLRVVFNAVRDVPPPLLADPGQSPPRLISVARFQAPKDPLTLLRALALLRSEPWTLDLVGDGPLEPQARSLAASLGLSSRVRFLGCLSDPAEALSRAQLFVLSTVSEALPRSILEAFRAALPVVASNVGGIPELVCEGVTGCLVPPRDSSSLAAVLSQLLAAPALRKRMGLQARRTYEDRFRFERLAGEMEALYDTVISGRATLPGCLS